MDAIQYESMVGSLLHVARATHPDIYGTYCWNSISVQCRTNLSSFNCSQENLLILKGNTCLQYKPTGNNLMGYSDADWTKLMI